MASSGSTQSNTSNNGSSSSCVSTDIKDRLRNKSWFPLKSISDVVKFFRYQLETSDPDLSLLSIIAGFIEIKLTTTAITTSSSNAISVTAAAAATNNTETGSTIENLTTFPAVTFDIVDTLYTKFQTILSIVEKPKTARYANRIVIKKISDIIWHSLIRSSYKDRAHLQHLYSYLSANKLDCFGVAMSVVAGCQLLGYKDVHLAISEDHAWIVFGIGPQQHQKETVEVTWHGKGHEDKRGQEISIDSRTWLYLSGHPVICNRYMEVAAIVSAINIGLTPNSDCLELADLQQKLLWMLYDMKHLEKYPMSLGNLGELEEVSPNLNRPTCEDLYREAIKSSRKYYDNHHVYPYTYQGLYYYRHNNYREAFASWANAGDVIRLYNYSRDDEEIYKEFMDIANEMIPYIMKTESSGHSARSILRDSECFANLLRFYDGICQWEEGSLTPILHIGWAKPLVNTISKFDYDIRSQVIINCAKDDEEVTGSTKQKEIIIEEANKKIREKDENHIKKEALIEATTIQQMDEGNNNYIKKDEVKLLDAQQTNKKSDIPTLADLTAACGEKILNPDFLLQGGGQLFAEHKQRKSLYAKGIITASESNGSSSKTSPSESFDQPSPTTDDEQHKTVVEINNTTIISNNKLSNEILSLSADIKNIEQLIPSTTTTNIIQKEQQQQTNNDDDYIYVQKNPIITLYSQKMKGLKDLLISEKLNTHAISLQVTAQSQVAGKKVRGSNSSSGGIGGTTNTSGNIGDKSNLLSSHNTSSDSIEQTTTSSRPKRTRRE